MRNLSKYLVAITPLVLFYSVWKLGAWAFKEFNCVDSGKFIEPCFAFGVNIQGFLGFASFWCQLFFWLSLPVTAIVIINIGARHIGSYRARTET